GLAKHDCRARSTALLESLGLTHAAERRVGTYSGGMRRRLDLGATLIGEPALLLLDEPTSGLDPRSRLELWDLISEIARSGTGVLVTSQNLDEIEQLADRVTVLDGGTVIADDTVDTIRQQIGGRIIDVAVDADHLDEATAALQHAGFDAQLDPNRRRVVATTTGGLLSVLDAANALTSAAVEPSEFSLRVPRLEEAFLALTEAPTGEADIGALHKRGQRLLPDRIRPVVTRSARRDIAVLVGRDVKRLLRSPESLFFAAVMPIMFVLGLTAVFGDLVEAALGQGYIQFLLPGVLVMQITLAAGATGVGLATDLRDGIIDRFRSLPIAQSAVLAGRTTADLSRNAFAAAVMVAAGFAIGYRLDGGVLGGIAALGVALLFGYATTWVFAAAGLAVKDPQAATFIGFAPVLLFVYLSSAWVPIDTMHPAVRGIARHQPVNVTIEAVRGLADGTVSSTQWIGALAWSVGILAVFASIATRQLRAATS
ncbi:MAG: ABC transporter permease, partial [Acidimicrobiales bacterium]|nr:ABC transporter permease [Acidimicrobiales bacterium]